MNESFEMLYNTGILSKNLFLESKTTNDFIDWLIPLINGDGENLRKIKFDHAGKYKNFIDAIKEYKWPIKGDGLDFGKTVHKFIKWRKDLECSEQEQLLKICHEILNWGGILKSQRLEKINNLRFFLDHMNKKLSQDEILIYDLNSNYINSGFTKIYAALNEKFIMYDGRVGAALCYLIRSYLQSENKTKLPVELKFGWGMGMGDSEKQKNRNPNNTNSAIEKFEEITKNRELHFIGNIKANWLLEAIAKKTEIPDVKEENKVFALQTALFVLGEQIPA